MILVVSMKDNSIKDYNSISSYIFGNKLNISSDIEFILSDSIHNIFNILEKDSNHTFWLKDKNEKVYLQK